MLNRGDLLLYLCTDRVLAMGRPITEAVEQAIKGGVTMVQVREKDAPTRDFLQVAGEIKEICRAANIPLVVNDRVDIALAVKADGLHLGQSDMPLPAARELTGGSMFIGVSAATVQEIEAAQRQGADYLGVGAVFATGSKPDVEQVLGLQGLRRIVEAVSVPTVAIGGIQLGNAGDVMQTGTDGVAVISAILSQPDITAAARALREAVER